MAGSLRVVASAFVIFGALAWSVPAHAAGEGSIDHAETVDGVLRVLYSVPEAAAGVTPDLESVLVSVDGATLDATAEPAGSADATVQVRRTAVLAIDTSESMSGDRFTEAKAAARAFIEAAPSDVYIGVVAFAGDVDVVQSPTLDREAATSVLDGLSLSRQTRLYDGVMAAASAAGVQGQRSLLVLSDGRDTSDTKLTAAIEAIETSGVRVDVVALGEAAGADSALDTLATAGRGTVVAAEDPAALTALFDSEAAALARQVLITATLPEEVLGTEGSLAVSIEADGEAYSATAFVPFGEVGGPSDPEPVGPRPVPAPAVQVTSDLLWAGLGALGLGVLVILLGALGVLGRRERETVEDKISAYTRAGAARHAAATRRAANPATRNVAESAVDLAQKALKGNAGLEAGLGAKLEGADLSLKPAEWLLVHSGIVVSAGVIGFLISSGGLFLTALLLIAGMILPWLHLGMRRSKRQKAFNGQLAETLQLIAGSLSAGLSLAQSLDTVVREGSEPIAGEFRRALIGARLGVAVEDSLESIAKRMESEDFEWIVMAIRIQREVGGNLSELLLKVAATMRERDYLRRQVKTLSAEGKLSGWILGSLPPGMLAYMLLTNPNYLMPMFETPLGWLMLGTGVVLLAIGAFWMSRVVKVEV